MKKVLIFSLMFVFVLALSGPAKAIIIVDNWTLDLTGVDGLTMPPTTIPISNIQQITYHGIAHNETVLEVAPVGSSVGDIGITDGSLAATGFVGSGGSIISTDLNDPTNGFEFTFDYSIAGQNVAVSGSSIEFTHLGPGTYGGYTVDGVLDIWIDNLYDAGGQQASTGTGDGYRDGTKIASMVVLPGDGGIFTPSTYDGSDDATFIATWVMSGVFLDEFGNDLSADPSLVMMAITDSNFDADPINQNGFSLLEPTNWSTYFSLTAGGNPPGDPSSSVAFYAMEDGSARIGVIPEPATMLLLGSGLFGLGFFGRKRTKK